MIRHVWQRAVESGAASVIVATDNVRVAEVAQGFGAEVVMTSTACQSGTDRVAEVCRAKGWTDDTPVVNVQGDAPLIPPESVRGVADLLNRHPEAAIATLCVPLTSNDELRDPNIVKVVFDRDGRALYFSRAGIPAIGHGGAGDEVMGWRHLGLYAYRSGPLQRISSTPPCELEQRERLEQLRAMWLGLEIRIAVDHRAAAPDVDTAEDLERVEAILAHTSDRT